MKGNLFFPLALEDENGREYKSAARPRAFRLVPQTDLRKILYRWEVAGQLRIEENMSGRQTALTLFCMRPE